MSSELIGLIEIDPILSGMNWHGPDRCAGDRFAQQDADYADWMAADTVCQTDFGQTDFVEADARRLMADLEAEFNRLLEQLPKR